ncbi:MITOCHONDRIAL TRANSCRIPTION TERMINATION FACTOR FAMILY PROTEIN [Salix koriyanagi]|uniref:MITOCHONDRIAL TRANSCRIPTION TERMINATION FACTOR FAMILY PROTEIN n=1 Tax=Salix koriyanagi TaxID=2511006 RepID=A0A9Q0ZBM0_9ROSI|nr:MITOCHONDRIAL TRANSCRIPTION TERMINATION FACTOR FAMILY PROTEIN [Salix koriyanagi]
MPAAAAAAALHSSLGFSSPKLTPQPSLSQQPNTQLTAKSKSLLHKHPLYTPAHTNISFEIKEKILCLEIMGVDSGKALSQNPSLHAASLGSIESIIFFLQSKGIQQKDLPRIFGMCPKLLTSDIRADLKPVFNFLSQDLKSPRKQLQKGHQQVPEIASF